MKNKVIFEKHEKAGLVDEIKFDRHSSIQRRFNRLKSKIFDHYPERKQMAVFADDYVSNKVLTHGVYEKQQLEILVDWISSQNTASNNIVLDIGANIGNHSLFLASYFRKCISFEPNPRTFDLLNFNSRLVDNIVAHNIGLSDASGEAELYTNFENAGASSLSSEWNRSFDQSHKIKLEKLDDFLAEETGKIDLIKIDVEGHEWFALKGAENIIRKSRPTIVFEYSPSPTETKADKDLIKLLNEFGYTNFLEIRDGWEVLNAKLRRLPKILRPLSKYIYVMFKGKVVHTVEQIEAFEDKQYLMIIACPD
jgi:FkbM family methyltransferase